MLVRITKQYADTGRVKVHVTTLRNKKHLENYLAHLEASHKIWGDPKVINYEILEE